MTLSDINNLSFDNIGGWPVPIKIIFILLIAAAIMGVTYWKDIGPLQESLKKVQEEEQNLRVTFEAKQKKAANLDALKQQLEDIKETFGAQALSLICLNLGRKNRLIFMLNSRSKSRLRVLITSSAILLVGYPTCHVS